MDCFSPVVLNRKPKIEEGVNSTEFNGPSRHGLDWVVIFYSQSAV